MPAISTWGLRDGISLYSKRVGAGPLLWPSPADWTVAISAAQLACISMASTAATLGIVGGRRRPAELRQVDPAARERGTPPRASGSIVAMNISVALPSDFAEADAL